VTDTAAYARKGFKDAPCERRAKNRRVKLVFQTTVLRCLDNNGLACAVVAVVAAGVVVVGKG
jgi:hypothetical protein